VLMPPDTANTGSWWKLHQTYIWAPDVSGSAQGAGGVGGLLMILDASQTSGGWFPCYDGNGNIMALVDAVASGTATAVYDYDAFGNPVRMSGTAAKLNPFRFSTKFTDDETELVYYGYRYYDPAMGRWLNRDSYQESGGINLYSIVKNNALCKYDLLGLRPPTVDEAVAEALQRGQTMNDINNGRMTPSDPEPCTRENQGATKCTAEDPFFESPETTLALHEINKATIATKRVVGLAEGFPTDVPGKLDAVMNVVNLYNAAGEDGSPNKTFLSAPESLADAVNATLQHMLAGVDWGRPTYGYVKVQVSICKCSFWDGVPYWDSEDKPKVTGPFMVQNPGESKPRKFPAMLPATPSEQAEMKEMAKERWCPKSSPKK